MWRLFGSRSMFIQHENVKITSWGGDQNQGENVRLLSCLWSWINKKCRVIVQENCCISSFWDKNYPGQAQNAKGLSNHGLVQLLVIPKNGLFGLFGPFNAKPSKKNRCRRDTQVVFGPDKTRRIPASLYLSLLGCFCFSFGICNSLLDSVTFFTLVYCLFINHLKVRVVKKV